MDVVGVVGSLRDRFFLKPEGTTDIISSANPETSLSPHRAEVDAAFREYREGNRVLFVESLSCHEPIQAAPANLEHLPLLGFHETVNADWVEQKRGSGSCSDH